MITEFIPDPIDRPYMFKVINKDGLLTDYSGKFKTKVRAMKWYGENGIFLESFLSRKLLLVKRVNKVKTI